MKRQHVTARSAPGVGGRAAPSTPARRRRHRRARRTSSGASAPARHATERGTSRVAPPRRLTAGPAVAFVSWAVRSPPVPVWSAHRGEQEQHGRRWLSLCTPRPQRSTLRGAAALAAVQTQQARVHHAVRLPPPWCTLDIADAHRGASQTAERHLVGGVVECGSGRSGGASHVGSAWLNSCALRSGHSLGDSERPSRAGRQRQAPRRRRQQQQQQQQQRSSAECADAVDRSSRSHNDTFGAIAAAAGGGTGSGSNNHRNSDNNNGGDSDDDDDDDDDSGDYPQIAGLYAWLQRSLQLPQARNRRRRNDDDDDDDRPLVVATTTIIHDLAQRIGGDKFRVVGLIKPGVDPHVYEPVPSDTILLENADMILFNGYGLEANMLTMLRTAGVNAQREAVCERVTPLPSNEYDSSSVPDPHVWSDARNAVAMVNAIADAFCALDDEHADLFRSRAADTAGRLARLDAWIRRTVATVPEQQRMLVTTHDAFQYYGKAYGLRILGTLIGINTEEQPSARTMLRLVQDIRRYRPPAVFFEQTINPVLIRTVAQDANVKLCENSLYSDSIGPQGSGAETYSQMMAYNTRVIVAALGGTVDTPPANAMLGDMPRRQTEASAKGRDGGGGGGDGSRALAAEETSDRRGPGEQRGVARGQHVDGDGDTGGKQHRTPRHRVANGKVQHGTR